VFVFVSLYLSIWVHFIISLGYLCIHCFSINFHRKKKKSRPGQ